MHHLQTTAMLATVKLAVLVAILQPVFCSSYPRYPYTGTVDEIRLRGSCSIGEKKNLHVNAWVRTYLYLFHNYVRSCVARGVRVFHVKGWYDLTKRLMTGMVYNCDLEKIAHRLLNYDGSHYQLHVYAVNHYEGPIASTRQYGWMWEMKNATSFWLGDFPSMQRLMYPDAPYMGCAYTTRSKHGRPFLKVVCVYDDRRHPWDPFMPKPYGKPCKEDRDCRRFGWRYECSSMMGLCFAWSNSKFWIA